MSDKVPSYNIDSTVSVGINLTQDLAVNEAVNNLKGGRADGGKAGGGNAFVNTPTRLAAFGVYYDIGAKKLAMVAPQVTGPNGDIACEAPAGIADGTYYCNVKLDTSSGEYTAVIETKAAEKESGKQTVASVKLFTLNGEKFTQHHTGAVVVSAGGGEADERSTTTSADNGAIADGSVSLFGFADAPSGAIPIAIKGSDGVTCIKWGTQGNFGVLASKSNGMWTYEVGAGTYTKARKQTNIGGLNVSSSCYVYLRVPISSSGVGEVVAEESEKTSDTYYTYIKLYYLSTDGSIQDFRGAPHIQVWE